MKENNLSKGKGLTYREKFDMWLKANRERVLAEIEDDLYFFTAPNNDNAFEKLLNFSVGKKLLGNRRIPVPKVAEKIEHAMSHASRLMLPRQKIQKSLEEWSDGELKEVKDLRWASLDFCEILYEKNMSLVLNAYTTVGAARALGTIASVGGAVAGLSFAFAVAQSVGLCFGIDNENEDNELFALRAVLVAIATTPEEKLEALSSKNKKHTRSSMLELLATRITMQRGITQIATFVPGAGLITGPLINKILGKSIQEAAHHMARLVWANSHHLLQEK